MKKGLTGLFAVIGVVAIVIILWRVGVFGGKEPGPNETISVPSPVTEENPVTFTMPAPITPTTTTTMGQGGENYTVKKGDTLWKIARAKYGDGSKYKIIEDANKDKISDAAKIKPGMVIFIPKLDSNTPSSAIVEPPAPKEKYHTVKKGDTLKKLALRYYKNSSKSDMIFEANRDKLATPETSLKQGWKLIIPPETPELPPARPTTPIPSGSPQ